MEKGKKNRMWKRFFFPKRRIGDQEGKAGRENTRVM
jgi:hypothetical protein